MFQYRQVLPAITAGLIRIGHCPVRLMGRPKVAVFSAVIRRSSAGSSPRRRCPMMPAHCALISAPRRARSTISTLATDRAHVRTLAGQALAAGDHAACGASTDFRGSLLLRCGRMLAQIHASAPLATTVRLTFAPGERPQLDFGAGLSV